MDKLKVGIIGCGGIACNRHIPAFQNLNNLVDVVAVQDVDIVLAKNVANDFNIKNIHESYHTMFEQVDAVAICTPNKFHC